MIHPSSPPHPVTPHNQGQPCNLHPLTKQADTAETHFGLSVLTIINNQCHDPVSRQGETNDNENDTNLPALVQEHAALVDRFGAEVRNMRPGARGTE